MAFLIKNLFLKARKLILKLEKISTQDFNILQCIFGIIQFQYWDPWTTMNYLTSVISFDDSSVMHFFQSWCRDAGSRIWKQHCTTFSEQQVFWAFFFFSCNSYVETFFQQKAQCKISFAKWVAFVTLFINLP